jgi:hypothetical protein
MVSPKDFYKSTHPDYFSDTEVEEVTEIDRSLLEYHLNSLTSRSQEADFELFARRLCEKEICPNLLPTTGPTGGGDSKADSETFPVADSLALKWYGGIAREASEERWAFAFSAKADWLPKVKSDIKKIAETGRGYSKAIFVTNQAIAARNRAKAEDDLKAQYGLDVRILDRTWILERTFAGRHERLAVEELKVTGIVRRDVRPGPVDSSRIAELEALEARIAETIGSGRFGSHLVDDALEAADLCRCLERPRTEVEGSYVRADRLAVKCGSGRQKVEAAYQWAWTLFWWFEDLPSVIAQYEVVEDRARGSENIYDLERLDNLWTILFVRVMQGEGIALWMEERTSVLQESLTRLSLDESRPSTALQAKSFLLKEELMRLLLEDDDPSPALDGLREVIEATEGLVGFPVKPLAKMISFIGARVGDSDAYDSLLEKLVDVESRRESEIRAARLLLTRGNQLMDQQRLTKAITTVGRALARLYKHETRRDIVKALFLCGFAYERLGLLWAARGTYLSGASIAANDFWTYGTVSQGFADCANRLKWVELRLGRFPHLLSWHELDMVIRSAENNDTREEGTGADAMFDGLAARLILRVPPELHSKLGALPQTLDRLGLYASASSVLFLLGHKERMEELVADEAAPEEVAEKIWNLSADVPLAAQPQLCEGNRTSLSTKILGCKIVADCSTEPPCIEVAETIFAILESMLSTSAIERAFATEPEVTIDVDIGIPANGFFSIEAQERLGRSHFIVRCLARNPYELVGEDREKFRDEAFTMSLTIFPHIAQFRDFERDLESLFKDEQVADRASAFAGTVGSVRNVLGGAPKFRIRDWTDSEAVFDMIRSEPWRPASGATPDETPRSSPPRMGKGEAPPGLFDYERVSHEQITVMSPIRQRLWDRAKWSAVVFMRFPDESAPPVLGIVFGERSAGLEIFQAWRSEFGETDEGRALRIAIVRGIDSKKPHAYRVLVGGNFQGDVGANNITMVVQRINLMDATTPVNLNGFVASYGVHGRFLLAPAFMGSRGPMPDFEHAIGIYELTVRNAWEIGLNDPDIAGVHADDDVIVPPGIETPPVKEVQAWKRKNGKDD